MLRIFIGAALGAGATYWIMHNAEVQKKKELIKQIIMKRQGEITDVNAAVKRLMAMDINTLWGIANGYIH